MDIFEELIAFDQEQEARNAAELDILREQVERMRKALAFYADTSKYHAPLTGGLGDLYFDCGTVAKEALK